MLILNRRAVKDFWNGNHPTATEKYARRLLAEGKLVFALALIGDFPKVVRLTSLEELDKNKGVVKYFYK